MTGQLNIAPTAPKPRQVLALLIFRRNATVQTSEILDELWEGGPPASAMTTMQTYVYKLRKMLIRHSAADMLFTRPGGYTLSIPDSAIDLHRFEQNARKGNDLLLGGDPERAREALCQALSQWHGPVLADLTPGRRLSSYVTRLEELRVRTLEQRIEADLLLGHHRELISELKSLVLTHMLHERLHAFLMTALHRSGRRHEALETYQTLRSNMIEDLGLEPGKELQDLHSALLADAPLDHPFSSGENLPSRRRASLSASHVAMGAGRSAGAERAGRPAPASLVAASAPASAATLAPAPAPAPAPAHSPTPAPNAGIGVAASRGTIPAQLPADIADFSGRSDVVKDAQTWFLDGEPVSHRSAPRVVLISGMPGIGKTTLAVRLAHQLRHLYDEGQLFIEYAVSLRRPKDLSGQLLALLEDLGVPRARIPQGLERRSKLFRSVTSSKRLLLLLDDVSSVADVLPLLPNSPHCAVIVTSRRRLHGIAATRTVDLDVFEPTESMELLSRIAGSERVRNHRLAAERLTAVSAGLPLAVRSIGSRLAAQPRLPIETLACELAQTPHLLDSLRLGDLDVRSRFDASYENLTSFEQGVFRRLSRAPSTEFTLPAAVELTGLNIASVRSTVEKFTDDHLLRIAGYEESGARYGFHALLWMYARERRETAFTA
ncbi:AfsR/SARP family transcriptional regulator [Streptomyces griseus]|uniref:AfsR/SARP family transcriptional regulator n=1 Tax=Streptomyces griseus TaxID=1911 RepID=UPI00131CFE35|nr:AfsR/SARP family transcriptional regulator [Streptomyces griseus]